VLISAAPASIKKGSLEVSGSSNTIDRKSAVGDTHVPPCSALFLILYISEEYDCFLSKCCVKKLKVTYVKTEALFIGKTAGLG
jgi:hypothetical protein